MTFTDVSGMSSDPSLYLLQVPVAALSSIQALGGYVSGQASPNDPSMYWVQIVPNSAADQFIRQ